MTTYGGMFKNEFGSPKSVMITSTIPAVSRMLCTTEVVNHKKCVLKVAYKQDECHLHKSGSLSAGHSYNIVED